VAKESIKFKERKSSVLNLESPIVYTKKEHHDKEKKEHHDKEKKEHHHKEKKEHHHDEKKEKKEHHHKDKKDMGYSSGSTDANALL
jgi:hypothetical protein